MKHIKTLTLLLLTNSFAMNEVTWKEIEAEIKPHIEDIEFDFSEIKKNISEVYKQYKETTGTATEFDDFGDYLTEKEKAEKEPRNEQELTKRRQENKEKAEEEKKLREEAKTNEKELKAEKIKQITQTIQTIIKSEKKDNIKMDNIKVTSNKDILQGIDKILKNSKNTASIVANFNFLKTFSDIADFTKNYNQIKKTLKKVITHEENKKENIEIFFYNLIFSAMTEKRDYILELFDFPKSMITEIKENKKIELKDTTATKIAHAFYNYVSDLLKILYTNRTKLDNFILKNKITSEYLLKQKANKEQETKKVFKNKSLNNMTIFEALSSEKNKETVRAESPSILALLEKFKGTEEENKKMTVRHAINILIDFTELSFAQPIEEQKSKTEIRKQKKEILYKNFYQKKNERIEKIQSEIKKLESQKRNTNEKDTKILDKEINALKNTIEKIKQEEYKEQTHINAKTEENRAEIALEKTKRQGKEKGEAAEANSQKNRKKSSNSTTTDEEYKKALKERKSDLARKKISEEKRFEPNFIAVDEKDTKEAREKALEEKKLRKNQINDFIKSKKYRNAISFINKIQNNQEKNELKEYFDTKIDQLNINTEDKKKIKALTEKKINNEEEIEYKEEGIDQLFISKKLD